jgi:hypothetical protein
MIENMSITGVSMRLGKGTMRVILTTDLPMATAMEVIPNMDADEPRAQGEVITGLKTGLGRLRASTISDYGPYVTKGVVLKEPASIPRLSVVGLDIEVSTIKCGDGMPLMHDPFISITVSKGGWYDREFRSKCFCLYTFGRCSEVTWKGSHPATLIKMNSDAEAVMKTYEI